VNERKTNSLEGRFAAPCIQSELKIICRSSNCRRCPWNVKQFNVSSASSQAGPCSASNPQWQIGKRKCASTCRRMRGDVVRLREATTTTFSLEASEPAIAPCPWFRPVQEIGTKSSKEGGLTLDLQTRCENRQETNTVLLCIRKMRSSFSHFVSRMRVIVSLLSCGM